jgi:hypothetical protein
MCVSTCDRNLFSLERKAVSLVQLYLVIDAYM